MITGLYYSQVAYSYRNSGYTYQDYDCIGFVNLCRSTAGISYLPNGTNSLWRSNRLYWKGTIADCIAAYGQIPQGALIFKCHPEGTPGYDTIPPQYYGDGIGNFTHVGIRTYLGQGVMQSGGYGGTGVHDSYYASSYWTHVGLADEIVYEGVPYTDIPQELLIAYCFGFKSKNKLQRVIRDVRFFN